MRILLTGTFSSLNKGDEARVKSTIEMLKRRLTDTHLAFLSYNFDNDSNTYRNYDLEIVRAPWQKNDSKITTLLYMGIKGLFVMSNAILWRVSNKSFANSIKNLQQYDMFIDLSGESLSDYFGQINLFFCLYQILLGIILKKKVVIYAQSIGPFDNTIGRCISRFILNKVNLITLRDKESFEYLQKYNINKPIIYLTADPAFLLESASSERISEILNKEGIEKTDKPLIGFSIRGVGALKRGTLNTERLEKKYQRFIKVISEVADYLVEEKDAEIVFIPHVIIPMDDDRIVHDDIYQSVKHKYNFKIIRGDYTPDELKGLIGECDLFIGSRMHANIAALSTFTPIVAIAYSHKMVSLMKMLKQENYVCDVMSISFDEVISKILDAWNNGDRIKKELEGRIEKMKQDTLLNAELVADFASIEKSSKF